MLQYTNRSIPRVDLNLAMQDFNSSDVQYIANMVMPIVDRNKMAANFGVFSAENDTTGDTRAANGGELNMVTALVEDTSYACKKYGIGSPVTKEDIANYKDTFDAERLAAIKVRQIMLNSQEIRVAGKVFNTNTFTTGNGNYTDVSSAPWATTSTDIIAAIGTAAAAVRAKSGFKPDSIAIGYTTLLNMLKNEKIIARFPGAPVVTQDMIKNELANLFGLRNLYVGDKVYNSAKEGQAFSGSDIWSATYANIFVKSERPEMGPGLGWQFNWTGDGEDVDLGYTSYSVPQRGGIVVQEINYRDEVVYDTGKYGHLLKIA